MWYFDIRWTLFENLLLKIYGYAIQLICKTCKCKYNNLINSYWLFCCLLNNSYKINYTIIIIIKSKYFTHIFGVLLLFDFHCVVYY